MDSFDTSQLPTGLTVGRLKAIALRQWWVVVLCGVVAAVGAAAYAEERPVHYVAEVVVSTGTPQASSSQSGPALSLPDPLGEVGSSQVTSAAASAAGTSDVSVTGAVSTDGTQVELQVSASSPLAARRGALAAANEFVKVRAHDIDAEASGLSPRLAALSAKLLYLDRQASGQGSTGGTGGGGTSLPTPLSTELSVLTTQYSSLYGEQLQLQLAGQAVQVDQNGPPSVSSTGGGKKKLVSMALGVGLLAGFGLGLLRDLTQDRLTSASELPELSKLTLLAEIPEGRLRRKQTVISTFGSRLGEAVRELRTSVSLGPGGRPAKVLLVTSAATSEGKSFLASNLAVAYALAGARTVLVSSDLRHPVVERLVGLSGVRKDGLATLLTDLVLKAPHEDAQAGARQQTTGALGSISNAGEFLVPTQLHGLAVIPAGPLPPNPAELIASRGMPDLVEWLRAHNDVVILDSPPVLAVTDAVILSNYVDAVILVVASGRSSKSNVRRALGTLERGGAPVVGYVLNRVTRSTSVPYKYMSPNKKLNGSAMPAPASTRAT